MSDWLDDSSIASLQTPYPAGFDEGWPDWLATALPPDLMVDWSDHSPVDPPSDLPIPSTSAQPAQINFDDDSWPTSNANDQPPQFPTSPIHQSNMMVEQDMAHSSTATQNLKSTSPSVAAGPGVKRPSGGSRDEHKTPACDGCRIRRIKCIREAPGARCNACIKKKVKCVLTPRQRKPYKNRGGKRLDMAIAVCGGEEDDASDEGPLSELDSSFVDIFYETLVLPSSIVRWRQLRRQLQEAAGSLGHMDEVAAVLVRVIKVFGAMLSNRSEVLGQSDVPHVTQLEAYRGQDLSKFGLARQTVLRKLHDEATKAFTAADMFRSSSAEASTAALFFNRLESYFEGSHTAVAARPYLNLASSIFRDLNGDVFNLFARRVVFVAGWELLVEDAFWAAWKAGELTISDYMMTRIVHPFDINPAFDFSLETLIQDVQSTDPLIFLKPLALVWLGMVGLVRKTALEVSLVIARTGTLPEEAIHEILQRYQVLLATSRTIAKAIPPAIPPAILQRQKAAVSLHLDTQLEAVFMPLHHVLLVIKKDITAWQEKQTPEHPDYSKSYILQTLVDQHTHGAAAQIAKQLAARPLQEAIYDNSSFGRFLEFLPRWAAIALETPIGPNFTKQQILANARILIDSVMVQTYVWPNKAVEANRLAESYGNLARAA